jgi:hypothetical protein
MYMVENGSRVYDPSSKRYFEVYDWEKGFQTEQAPYVCSPAGFSGQVEWSPTGEPGTWKLLHMGLKLPENAHIKTMEESSCILSFPDMSTYVMKEESHIVLTTDPEAKRSKLSIAAGRVWVNVKKMLETGSMEVEMQQAVCGIKGTTFVCEEIDGKSTLKVIEGTVEYTSKIDGQAVMVEGGQQVVADAAGLSELTAFDAAAEDAEWAALAAQTAGASEALATAEPDRDAGINPLLLILPALVIILVVVILVAVGRKKKKTVTAGVRMPQQPKASFCAQCGSSLPPGSAFCAACGKRIE